MIPFDSSSLNEFQPISLLDWVHNLVARVLGLRLRRMLESLIRRTPMESYPVASEVVDAMRHEGKRFLFKIDF